MAMVLNPGELATALTMSANPEAARICAAMQGLCNEAAALLAAGLGITALPAVIDGDPMTNQGVVFEPAFAGQECPELLAEFDDASEWDE